MRIIYLDIDSLRPDHLGCYGYPRPTSPVIDELARSAVRFTNCHTSDAPCLPSRAALFSGRLGIQNGVTCHEGPASQMRYAGRGHTHDPARPMWMRALQTAGWETVCFSGFGQRHLAWWFFAGFTQHFGNQLPGGRETADDVMGKALAWLRANGTSDNWFLHLNVWDVHTPYAAPAPFYDRMRGRQTLPLPGPDDVARDTHAYYGPRTPAYWWYHLDWQNPQTGRTARMPRENPVDYETFLEFVDGYDAGIAYVDERFGDVLETLAKLGVRDETAVIVGADHGEAVGELGMYFEHGNATEGTTHVPLILHWPGLTREARALDGLLYQLDLPPTVLDLLGMPVPEHWDGVSLAHAVRGEPWRGRDHLVLGCGIYSYQRAVRTPRHRLIRTIHSGLFNYEPLYLFDLQADPLGRVNLAEQEPQRVAELDHLLLEFLWRHTTGPDGVRDPFQEQLRAGVSPDIYCPRSLVEERMRMLGRGDHLADLARRRDLQPPLRPW